MGAAAHSPIRVVLCKSGLDEHDRGARYVARKLMEAGMEVVYLVFRHPVEVVAAAIQEDADVIGLSSFAGGHLAAVRRIRDDLQQAGAPDVALLVGGIVPDVDRVELEELGVAAVFGPGSDPGVITAAFAAAVAGARGRAG
ncbi:MAG: cobalamin B12-binding domain-containing protein [Acidimicrobiia bacterium]